jgi:hypothetical protein
MDAIRVYWSFYAFIYILLPSHLRILTAIPFTTLPHRNTHGPYTYTIIISATGCPENLKLITEWTVFLVIISMLRLEGKSVGVRIPADVEIHVFTASWPTPSPSQPCGKRLIFSGVKELAAILHLISRLRTHGAVAPLHTSSWHGENVAFILHNLFKIEWTNCSPVAHSPSGASFWHAPQILSAQFSIL